MNIKKVTPVRIVDRIEPCLSFWCQGLGYEKRASVPHEGEIGFVILEGPAGELMFQTKESLAADLPAVAARNPGTLLFVEVASLAAARKSAKGGTMLIEERETFYGTREAVLVDPEGTVVIFAEKT
jgi:uncharacterized glyoxalase superfamily protein PhnB